MQPRYVYVDTCQIFQDRIYLYFYVHIHTTTQCVILEKRRNKRGREMGKTLSRAALSMSPGPSFMFCKDTSSILRWK